MRLTASTNTKLLHDRYSHSTHSTMNLHAYADAYGGAPNVEHAQWVHGAPLRRNLWERCCVVVCICPLTLGTSMDVMIWDGEGPQRPKGHFQDHEVGANCIVLLTVLC